MKDIIIGMVNYSKTHKSQRDEEQSFELALDQQRV